MREIDGIDNSEWKVVIVFKYINLLLVVHHEESLFDLLFSFVYDKFTIKLKGNDVTSVQLPELFLLDQIFSLLIEFNLNDFLCTSMTLAVEDFFFVASYHMLSDHGSGLADYFLRMCVE